MTAVALWQYHTTFLNSNSTPEGRRVCYWRKGHSNNLRAFVLCSAIRYHVLMAAEWYCIQFMITSVINGDHIPTVGERQNGHNYHYEVILYLLRINGMLCYRVAYRKSSWSASNLILLWVKGNARYTNKPQLQTEIQSAWIRMSNEGHNMIGLLTKS